MEFKNFIKSLERDNNKSLIESILKGFSVCFEGEISKNWVYHNTKSDFLYDIIKEGFVQGSFSDRPIDFGGDVWLAVDKNILPSNIQEHQYGNAIAIELPGGFIISPDQLYLATKKGKIIRKLIQDNLNESSKNLNIKNYNKFPLSALVKQARKFDNFKNFSRFYSIDIYHGYYWHLTDNPNFKISKETGPRDMSSMASGNISEKGAMMITSHLENWDSYYNDEKLTRPYAVLLDASDIEPNNLKQVSRGFGNEVYVNATNAEKLKIIGIYDIKYAKRLDKKFDAIIPGSEEELEELWKFANNKNSITEAVDDENEYWWNELSPEEQDKYLLQEKLKKIPKKKFRKYVTRDKKLWEEAKQIVGKGGPIYAGMWVAVQSVYNKLYFAKYGHEPRSLQESVDYDVVENYYNKYDDILREILTEVNHSKKGEHIPWSPVSLRRIKKIWNDFMNLGIIRDERGLDSIAEEIIEKIITLDVSTTLSGHSTESPEGIVRETLEIEPTEEYMRSEERRVGKECTG